MHVVITGANRGIGKEIAARFVERGDEVTGTARDEGGLAPLDVSDPASVTAFAESLGERPVDLLVCNAGVYLDKGESIQTGYAPDLWARTFAVNVTGVFLTVQALLPHLRRAERPKIAILSSVMASDAHASGGSYVYRASKAAVLNLGRNLAVDLRDAHIAVGVYHPGWVRTEMGGGGAAIEPAEAASGLVMQFDALNIAMTGAFLTWDGRVLDF
ncbi:SDR family oxidoreductase [Roseovarius spongiae]|uniref:SDR family oxidoreductase n=1 Tax=Roseovarius spongiae TaxID=2320272 RepID=A0A3A8B6F0_9RHOB|nr:SDR family oxidoreductase [Roseovarius spongiae]RKF16615.1 SDR family oxidoreductase [Roseovarius spongiae]